MIYMGNIIGKDIWRARIAFARGYVDGITFVARWDLS